MRNKGLGELKSKEQGGESSRRRLSETQPSQGLSERGRTQPWWSRNCQSGREDYADLLRAAPIPLNPCPHQAPMDQARGDSRCRGLMSPKGPSSLIHTQVHPHAWGYRLPVSSVKMPIPRLQPPALARISDGPAQRRVTTCILAENQLMPGTVLAVTLQLRRDE
jgi:hypothetical protein